MSKLDELIKEFCPNGVEYKKLGDIATISRGGNFQKKIMLRMEFHVYTMGKYTHSMDYLLTKRLAL